MRGAKAAGTSRPEWNAFSRKDTLARPIGGPYYVTSPRPRAHLTTVGRLPTGGTSEVTAIPEEVQPDCIHVVYCDASVQGIQKLTPPESVVPSPKAGAAGIFGRRSNGSENKHTLPHA